MAYARPYKCYALRGDTAQRYWAWPDDYRFWGNRAYIKASCKFVRFWVNWQALQPGSPGSTIQASWDQLNTAYPSDDYNTAFTNSREPTFYLRKLDRQIRAANDDGVLPILTIYGSFPGWANGYALEETRYKTGTTTLGPPKPGNYRWPTMDVNQGFGWFIGHLCARYNVRASYLYGYSPNPWGPHAAPYPGENPVNYGIGFGNTSGGYIQALEIVNEPNHFNFPQVDANGTYQTPYYVVQAALIAKYYANAYGWPPVMLPALLDCPQDNYTPPYSTDNIENAFEFSSVANQYGLPGGFVNGSAWSMHNYGDIKYSNAWDSSNASEHATIANNSGWSGVWLSEGGYDPDGTGANASYAGTSSDSVESSLVHHEFNQMDAMNSANGAQTAVIFSNYGINDYTGDNANTGIRDAFQFVNGNWNQPAAVGANRVLSSTWSTM